MVLGFIYCLLGRNKLHRHLNDTDHAALKNRRALYCLQKKYGDSEGITFQKAGD